MIRMIRINGVFKITRLMHERNVIVSGHREATRFAITHNFDLR